MYPIWALIITTILGEIKAINDIPIKLKLYEQLSPLSFDELQKAVWSLIVDADPKYKTEIERQMNRAMNLPDKVDKKIAFESLIVKHGGKEYVEKLTHHPEQI